MLLKNYTPAAGGKGGETVVGLGFFFVFCAAAALRVILSRVSSFSFFSVQMDGFQTAG